MSSIRVKVPRLRRIKGRYYWRPTPMLRELGFANVALGRELVPAIEMAQRLNERAAAAKLGRPAAPMPGSVAAVVREYSADESFASKAEATRRGYRQVMTAIERDHGATPIADVTRPELIELLRAIERDRGLRTAREFRKLWSILLTFSQNIGLRPDNPILGYRQRKPAARRTVWTLAQVRAACAAAKSAGRPSIALALSLAYWTSQRLTDILALDWSAVAGAAIMIEQSKGGSRVAVPIAPELMRDLRQARAVARKTKRVGGPIVVNESTGRPYLMTTFSHDFAEIRKAAELPPGLWFRDLRRTALTEAGAGGATIPELQALGGHKTIAQLADYVVPTTAAATRAAAARNKGRAKVATGAKIRWQPKGAK